MARDAFEGLLWEEVGDEADGKGVASPLPRGALKRPVPAGLGRPHPDRARQFMPFAALRGYYGLVHAKEIVPEPRRPLTEEEARVLDEQLASLERGTVVRATFYRDNGYRDITGAVSQVDLIYRNLWIVRDCIPFAELCAIEVLYPAG